MVFSLLMLSFAPFSSAQTSSNQVVSALRIYGDTYIALDDVAALMGFAKEVTATRLHITADAGAMTLTHTSPDVLWQATGKEDDLLSLATPVEKRQGHWFASSELLNLFGLALNSSATKLILPQGTELALTFISFESYKQGVSSARALTHSLKNGVPALSLFAEDDSHSLMIVDMQLLSLAYPEQREQFDSFMSELTEGRPLFFIVAALEDRAWQPTLSFRQNANHLSAREPLQISVLEGDTSQVSPDSPVMGIVTLPTYFDLREPILVEWAGARQVMQFRKR